MRKSNIFIKLLIIFVALVVLAVGVLTWIVFDWANNTEIEMVNKTCRVLDVTENELIDYNTFLAPTDQAIELFEIKEDVRFQIADYMKIYNLKLKQGIYTIPIVGISNEDFKNYPFEYYMKIFEFEKIN